MLTQSPPADWIAEHRRVWAHKAGLRAVCRATSRCPPGGFQSFGLPPASLTDVAHALDRVLSAAPALTATRCTLTLERRG